MEHQGLLQILQFLPLPARFQALPAEVLELLRLLRLHLVRLLLVLHLNLRPALHSHLHHLALLE